MKKKIAVIWVNFVMVLSFIVIIVEIAQVAEAPTIIYVDDMPGTGPGNPPENFTSIQDAINAAIDGDTVFVYNGTYYENLVINKMINLIGEDRNSTVINGSGTSDVIFVSSNWVNITGFKITRYNVSFGDAGIEFYYVQNCSLTYNNISTMNQHKYAVFLYNSNWINIKYNNVTFNKGEGIRLHYSSNNTILGNNISNNSYGIYCQKSPNNYISGNNITNNSWYGLYLAFSPFNIISNNNFINDGIFPYGGELSSFNTQIITPNNIVYFKPLYYYKDQNNITLDGEEVGQIILVNCSDIKVRNIKINYTDIGIIIAYSNNITIESNIIEKCIDGINIYYSFNNNINSCEVSNRENGLYLYSSCYHSLSSIDIIENKIGIKLTSSSNNTFIGNNISLNTNGMKAFKCNDNTIMDNNISLNNDGIWLSGNNNIITNNNISLNICYGIYLYGAINTTITNNNFIKDGIFVFGLKIAHFNTQNILTNNIINGKPLYYYKDQNDIIINGISVGQLIFINCSNVDVKNVLINYTDVGIEIAYSKNIIITKNNISNNYIGIHLHKSSNNNFTENNITHHSREGIFLYDSMNNNIINNNILLNKGHGTFFHMSNNNIIIKNNLSFNNNGLYYANSENVIINDNKILSNLMDGIHFESSWNNNIITNNEILFNNQYGIQIRFSSRTDITNNNISNNKDGVFLEGSDQNNISYNIVINNNYGIYLSKSDKNIVSNNNLSHNYYIGIDLSWSNENKINDNFLLNEVTSFIYGGIINYKSNQNIITRNIISNAVYGISIYSSSNNLIFHNKVIENDYQAYDNQDNNYWDNGYPMGGNYWSDYSGVDFFNGPNQDIPGSDGIGDTPYIIDSDSQDNYPLTEPWKYFMILKPGWNLISIPLIQNNQKLKKVLEMIDGYYDAVQWYDNPDIKDPWKHHKVGKPFGNDLSGINETMGFWIHITQPGDTIFIYNGTQPSSNQTIILHPGWNQVGYPSLTNYNRTQGLNNLTFDQEVDAIWTFDAATQKWEEIGSSDYFELGQGYWIHAKTKCEWEVPL